MTAPEPSPALSRLEQMNPTSYAVSFVVVLVATLGATQISFYCTEPIQSYLGLNSHDMSGDPPWYFIEHDFAQGVGSIAGLVLAWTIAAVSWRYLIKDFAAMMIWMAWNSEARRVWQSWVIYQSCPGLLSGGERSSRWTTFDSYLHDTRITWGTYAVFATTLVLAMAFAILAKRQQQRAAKANAVGTEVPA